MEKILKLQTKKIKARQTIFTEGEQGDCAYLIESGRVQILVEKAGHQFPISSLGPGDIFGEMSIIDGLPRSATAVALEDCTLFIVTKDLIADRVNQADPVVRFLISFLLKRIRRTNMHLSRQTDQRSWEATDPGFFAVPEDAQVVDQIKFESDLKQALDEKEFVLHYQPIVKLENLEVIGFEALIRWNNPKRGMVRPDLFMDVIENTSLVFPVGQWVLEQAMSDLDTLRSLTPEDALTMSINVSAKQFLNPKFLAEMEVIRRGLGLEANSIKLEVTERVFLEGPVVMSCLQNVRKVGYSVSLDDFGTGYSSLSYLEQMNVDMIKIDRSFVRNCHVRRRSRAIVKSVVEISRELNFGVIAEGVETKSELQELIALGCTLGQGYLFAKPAPLQDWIQYFEQRRKGFKKAA